MICMKGVQCVLCVVCVQISIYSWSVICVVFVYVVHMVCGGTVPCAGVVHVCVTSVLCRR